SSNDRDGPPGAGALWTRAAAKLSPVVVGGGQEGGYRAGTENLPAIVGMGVAADLARAEGAAESLRLSALRDRFLESVLERVPRARLTGARGAARLPHHASIVFDVDGTLVTARGAGRAAFGRALQATYGTPGAVDVYDFRGKTDPRIVWDLMRGAGLDDAAITRGLDAFFAAYLEELRRAIGDGSRVQVMPGVAAVVSALAARDDALVGLLTGNIEAGARLKLAPTGL